MWRSGEVAKWRSGEVAKWRSGFIVFLPRERLPDKIESKYNAKKIICLFFNSLLSEPSVTSRRSVKNTGNQYGVMRFYVFYKLPT